MTTPPVGYNQDTNFYSGTPLYGADYAAGTNSTISYTMSGNISDMSGGVALYTPDSSFFSGGYGTFAGDYSAGLSYGSPYGGGGLSYNDSSIGYYAPSGYSGGLFFGDTGYGGSVGGVSGVSYGDNTGYGSLGYNQGYQPSAATTPASTDPPLPPGVTQGHGCGGLGYWNSTTGEIYGLVDGQWVVTGQDPSVRPPVTEPDDHHTPECG